MFCAQGSLLQPFSQSLFQVVRQCVAITTFIFAHQPIYKMSFCKHPTLRYKMPFSDDSNLARYDEVFLIIYKLIQTAASASKVDLSMLGTRQTVFPLQQRAQWRCRGEKQGRQECHIEPLNNTRCLLVFLWLSFLFTLHSLILKDLP